MTFLPVDDSQQVSLIPMQLISVIFSSSRVFVLGAVFMLGSLLMGCGLLGSGGDEEDQNFPDPPGRPNSASVELLDRGHDTLPQFTATSSRRFRHL